MGFAAGVVGLAFVIFLNPWLAAFIVGGLLIGWLLGKGVTRLRPEAGSGSAVITFPIVATVALIAVGIYKLVELGSSHSRSPVSWTWPAQYKATVDVGTKDFDVHDQYYLSSHDVRVIDARLAAVSPVRRGGRPHENVIALLRARGWRLEIYDGKDLLTHHRLVPHRGIRYVRPRTRVAFQIPVITLRPGVVLAPARSSTVLLKAGSYFVARTDPTSHDDGDGNRTVGLETTGAFPTVSAVRVDVNSSWARNQPMQDVLAVVLAGPYAWIAKLIAIVGGALVTGFSEAIKPRRRKQAPAAEPAPAA